MNNQSKNNFVVLAVAIAAVFIASAMLLTTEADVKKKSGLVEELILRALIATSGDNVYIT